MGRTSTDKLELLRMRISLIQSRHDLQARLTEIGYPPESISAISSKQQEAVTRRDRCRMLHSAQKKASKERQYQLDIAKRRYSDLAAIARRLFRDNEPAQDALGLRRSQRATIITTTGNRISDARPAFLDRARALYNGLLGQPELLAVVRPFGYDEQRLAAERDNVMAIEEGYTEEQNTRLEAKKITAEQEQAMAEIDEWSKDFVLFTSIQLRDMPSELESMSIRPRR